MKISTFFFLSVCGLLLSSCSTNPPSKEEVRERIIGVYCADNGNYRLEIKDSTYFNRKVVVGPLGKGLNYESCNGGYSLELENKQWVLKFEKDNFPKTVFESCEKSFVIWKPDAEFVYGTETTVTLLDLIDGKTLTKGTCED